jgi:hypothetical protein
MHLHDEIVAVLTRVQLMGPHTTKAICGQAGVAAAGRAGAVGRREGTNEIQEKWFLSERIRRRDVPLAEMRRPLPLAPKWSSFPKRGSGPPETRTRDPLIKSTDPEHNTGTDQNKNPKKQGSSG